MFHVFNARNISYKIAFYSMTIGIFMMGVSMLRVLMGYGILSIMKDISL